MRTRQDRERPLFLRASRDSGRLADRYCAVSGNGMLTLGRSCSRWQDQTLPREHQAADRRSRGRVGALREGA